MKLSHILGVLTLANFCFAAIKFARTKKEILKVLQARNEKNERKVLVIDLDETLVYPTTKSFPHLDGNSFLVGNKILVYKRCYLDEFIDYIKDKFYVVIYTESSWNDYAKHVVENLDPSGTFIIGVFTKNDCSIKKKGIKKKMSRLDFLENFLIIDDLPDNYVLRNGETTNDYIRIHKWCGNAVDNVLLNLTHILEDWNSSDISREKYASSVNQKRKKLKSGNGKGLKLPNFPKVHEYKFEFKTERHLSLYDNKSN